MVENQFWWTAKDATAGNAYLSIWMDARAPGESLFADGPPADALAGSQVRVESTWTFAGHIMRGAGLWLWNAQYNTFGNNQRLLQVYVGIAGADALHTLNNNCDWIGLELFIPVDPITAY